MKITIDPFDTKSIDDALKNVEKFKIEFNKRLDEAVRRLSDYGLRVASSLTFGDASVVMIDNGNGVYTIRMSGETIYIVEFGAGVATDPSNMFVPQATVPVYPGSFSETHAQQFSTKGYWHWGKKKFTAVAPTRPMQTAYNEMATRLPMIVREVFQGL